MRQADDGVAGGKRVTGNTVIAAMGRDCFGDFSVSAVIYLRWILASETCRR
jgi:hypothetical protein